MEDNVFADHFTSAAPMFLISSQSTDRFLIPIISSSTNVAIIPENPRHFNVRSHCSRGRSAGVPSPIFTGQHPLDPFPDAYTQ